MTMDAAALRSMGVVHAAQGAAVLVLATSFTLPIVTHTLTGPPGSPSETITLFDLRIAWAVAAFMFITVIAHLVIASPMIFSKQPAHAHEWTEPLPLGRVLAECFASRPRGRQPGYTR
jgi:hypothetical protein